MSHDVRGPHRTRSKLAIDRRLLVLRTLSLSCGMLLAGVCDASQPKVLAPPVATAANVRLEESNMWMTIGKRRFAITLADTEAARTFSAMLPLTIEMTDLNSNEKHAELPKALPTKAARPGTIRAGDLMLYGSSTLVVFYATFDSAYSYTALGRVVDADGLAKAVGGRNVRVSFSRETIRK